MRPSLVVYILPLEQEPGEESDFLLTLLDMSLLAMSLPAWNTMIYYISQNPL